MIKKSSERHAAYVALQIEKACDVDPVKRCHRHFELIRDQSLSLLGPFQNRYHTTRSFGVLGIIVLGSSGGRARAVVGNEPAFNLRQAEFGAQRRDILDDIMQVRRRDHRFVMPDGSYQIGDCHRIDEVGLPDELAALVNAAFTSAAKAGAAV